MGFRMKSKAERNYMRRLMTTMGIYVLLVLCTTVLVRHGFIHGWLVYVFALLPCLPIFGLIYVMGLYLHEERDEFQRLLAVRSLLCATAVVLMVSAVSDFLRSYTTTGTLPEFSMFVTF